MDGVFRKTRAVNVIEVNITNEDWKEKAKKDFETFGFSAKTFKTRITIFYLYKKFNIYKFNDEVYIATIPERFYKNISKGIINFEIDLLKEWILVQNEKRLALEKKRNVIKFSTEFFEMQLQAEFDRLGITKTSYDNKLSSYKYINARFSENQLNFSLTYTTSQSYKKLDSLDLFRCKWTLHMYFVKIRGKSIENNLRNILESFSKDDLGKLLEDYEKLIAKRNLKRDIKEFSDYNILLGTIGKIEEQILEIFTKG